MRVEVRDSQKNRYDLEIEENASPQDFKNLFRKIYNQNIDNFKLIYKGREIKDDKKFSNYSVVKDSIIMILESKLIRREETKIISEPKIPQKTSLNPQEVEILSEANFPKTISSDAQLPKNNLKPLERLSNDLNKSIPDDMICQLNMMGFDPDTSRKLLIQTNGNLEEAIEILIGDKEPNTNLVQIANIIVDEYMHGYETQHFVWEIANNQNWCEEIIPRIKDAGQVQFILENKEIFVKACKKRVIVGNKKNKIEEVLDEPTQGQDYEGSWRIIEGMGSISSTRSVKTAQGKGAVRAIEGINRMGGAGMNGFKVDEIMNIGSDEISKPNKISYDTHKQDKDGSVSSKESFSSDSDE